jgi:hypothetical protein
MILDLPHKFAGRAQHHPIRYVEHRVAQALKIQVPSEIAAHLLGLRMGAALDFHDQPFPRAAKVHGQLSDRMLAPECNALEAESAKKLPGEIFRFGCVSTQFARSLYPGRSTGF